MISRDVSDRPADNALAWSEGRSATSGKIVGLKFKVFHHSSSMYSLSERRPAACLADSESPVTSGCSGASTPSHKQLGLLEHQSGVGVANEAEAAAALSGTGRLASGLGAGTATTGHSA